MTYYLQREGEEFAPSWIRIKIAYETGAPPHLNNRKTLCPHGRNNERTETPNFKNI